MREVILQDIVDLLTHLIRELLEMLLLFSIAKF
jgi:hypothetical protein